MANRIRAYIRITLFLMRVLVVILVSRLSRIANRAPP